MFTFVSEEALVKEYGGNVEQIIERIEFSYAYTECCFYELTWYECGEMCI